MGWLLIILLSTGQVIGLDRFPTEAECRVALARVEAGDQMTITTRDGLQIGVIRAFECRPKPATS